MAYCLVEELLSEQVVGSGLTWIDCSCSEVVSSYLVVVHDFEKVPDSASVVAGVVPEDHLVDHPVGHPVGHLG